MSDLDDLVEVLHEAPPREPRSALRMRNGRKQLPKRDVWKASIASRVAASRAGLKRPRPITLAKLNLPD